MSATNVTLPNGTTYGIPNYRDTGYAQGSGNLSQFLVAVAQYINSGTRPVFSQTANVTVGNTTSETTLVGTGVGSMVLAAGQLAAGRVYRLTASGVLSAADFHTATIRFKIGSTTIISQMDTLSPATNATWALCYIFTVRSTGASGSVMPGFVSAFQFNVPSITSASTINTTISQTVGLTIQFGTANPGTTATASSIILEALN